MKTTISIILLVFLFACSNPNQSNERISANQSNDPIKILIDSLILTLNDNCDMLHLDYTPSVHRLSELGIPAIVAILPLLNDSNEATRLHAQRVAEEVVSRMYGFVPGQGFSNNRDGANKVYSILKSTGYDYSDTPEKRQKAIKSWRKWITETENETSKALNKIE